MLGMCTRGRSLGRATHKTGKGQPTFLGFERRGRKRTINAAWIDASRRAIELYNAEPPWEREGAFFDVGSLEIFVREISFPRG